MEVAIALMWPGVPVTDCAIIRPCLSNTPQASSWLSRTIVLKAVLVRTFCCSLATERSRFQMSSSFTESSNVSCIRELHDHIEVLVHTGLSSAPDHQSRLAFLDNRRTTETSARGQCVAIKNRSFHIVPTLREIGRTRALDRPILARIWDSFVKVHLWRRSADNHTPVNHLERYVRTSARIQRLVNILEASHQLRDSRSVQGVFR